MFPENNSPGDVKSDNKGMILIVPTVTAIHIEIN